MRKPQVHHEEEMDFSCDLNKWASSILWPLGPHHRAGLCLHSEIHACPGLPASLGFPKASDHSEGSFLGVNQILAC